MKKINDTNDESYDGTSPSGNSRDGFTTFQEDADSPLAEAVAKFLIKQLGTELSEWERARRISEAVKGHPLEFTTHHCWSGYSEYTITSTWDEMSFKWGEFEHHFESMAEFFKALADADSVDTDV